MQPPMASGRSLQVCTCRFRPPSGAARPSRRAFARRLPVCFFCLAAGEGGGGRVWVSEITHCSAFCTNACMLPGYLLWVLTWRMDTCFKPFKRSQYVCNQWDLQRSIQRHPSGPNEPQSLGHLPYAIWYMDPKIFWGSFRHEGPGAMDQKN